MSWLNGGGAGSRTRVQKRMMSSTTCVVAEFNVSHVTPTTGCAGTSS